MTFPARQELAISNTSSWIIEKCLGSLFVVACPLYWVSSELCAWHRICPISCCYSKRPTSTHPNLRQVLKYEALSLGLQNHKIGPILEPPSPELADPTPAIDGPNPFAGENHTSHAPVSRPSQLDMFKSPRTSGKGKSHSLSPHDCS